jgi:hypothetical protein
MLSVRTPSRLSAMTQMTTVRRADRRTMTSVSGTASRGGQARERGEHRFEPGIGRLENLLDLIKNLLLTGRQAHLVLRGGAQRETLLCTLAGRGLAADPRMAGAIQEKSC